MVDLHSLVHKFRSIIDLLASNGEVPYFMKGFPSGCCGITSELLGDYLNSMGVGTFEYVWGELEGASHAWLECDGVIVDITSDQFEGRPSIYIGTPDAWYLEWEESSRHTAEHASSAPTYRDEHAFYERVLAEIE